MSIAEPPVRRPLTRRQREVLRLVAQGLTNREIGTALGIGEDTVRQHVEAIRVRLGLVGETRVALAWEWLRISLGRWYWHSALGAAGPT